MNTERVGSRYVGLETLDLCAYPSNFERWFAGAVIRPPPLGPASELKKASKRKAGTKKKRGQEGGQPWQELQHVYLRKGGKCLDARNKKPFDIGCLRVVGQSPTVAQAHRQDAVCASQSDEPPEKRSFSCR